MNCGELIVKYEQSEIDNDRVRQIFEFLFDNVEENDERNISFRNSDHAS